MLLAKIILLVTMGVIADSRNLKGKEHQGRAQILNEDSHEDTDVPATIKTKENRSDNKAYSNGDSLNGTRLNHLVSVGRKHTYDMSSGVRILRTNLQTPDRNKQQGRRSWQQPAKEAHFPYEIPKRSCPTKSEFTFLKEAEDMYGNIVQLAPLYQNDSTVIKQAVQELFCVREKCTCRGINGRKFDSACMTDYKFSVAKVIKDGQVGWSYIKIRSGCSCVIEHKDQPNKNHIRNILEIF